MVRTGVCLPRIPLPATSVEGRPVRINRTGLPLRSTKYSRSLGSREPSSSRYEVLPVSETSSHPSTITTTWLISAPRNEVVVSSRALVSTGSSGSGGCSASGATRRASWRSSSNRSPPVARCRSRNRIKNGITPSPINSVANRSVKADFPLPAGPWTTITSRNPGSPIRSMMAPTNGSRPPSSRSNGSTGARPSSPLIVAQSNTPQSVSMYTSAKENGS